MARTFASLGVRDFRYNLLSSTSLSFSQWFQMIGMGWLVYVVTQNPVQIGAVAAIRGVALILISFPAGILADRMDRRDLVVYSTAVAALQAAVLAVLVMLGVIQWWHLWILSVVGGIVDGVGFPARQALVYDQVGPRTLENAVVLTAITQNLARISGPTAAGAMIGFFGQASAFVALALLNIVGLGFTLLMRRTDRRLRTQIGSGLRGVMEGLAVIGRTRVLLGLLLLQAVPGVMVYPYLQFMPIYTSEVLKLGNNSFAYGFLLSAVGFGSLVAGALLAVWGSGSRAGVLMLGGQLAYMLMILLLSRATWLPVAFGILVMAGVFNTSNLAMNQTLFQLHVPDESRGRVLAVLGLSGAGLQPIGSLLMGKAVGGWGFPTTMLVFASCACIVTLTVSLCIAELWRLRGQNTPQMRAAG